MKYVSIFGSTRGILISAAVGLLLLFGGGVAFVEWQLEKPGPMAVEQAILVPKGVGMRNIAHIFEARGAIENPLVFILIGRLTQLDRNIRAGEYSIPAHASLHKILDILRSGQVVLHKLTVPEGLTSFEIVALLQATPGLTGQVLATPAEGSLLPQTYYYILGDDRNDILARMHKALSDYLAEIWPMRAKGLPFQNPEQAVILASIVEKETGIAAERSHVAGVYLNRIRLGMPLQADPTVSYGLTQGAATLDRALNYQDLRQSTPFNTYMNKGLPPGPIANPGALAIAAVLNPLDTKDLYFVADGSGGHRFAETIEAHNANVAKWRKIERDRGLKVEQDQALKTKQNQGRKAGENHGHKSKKVTGRKTKKTRAEKP